MLETIFYCAQLQPAGLLLFNADLLTRELDIDPSEAAILAASIRRELIPRHESHVFETVCSDPVGDKLSFLKRGSNPGSAVVLCFIGIYGLEVSDERMAMRVSQGGHDLPPDKLAAHKLADSSSCANVTRGIRQQ